MECVGIFAVNGLRDQAICPLLSRIASARWPQMHLAACLEWSFQVADSGDESQAASSGAQTAT